MKRFNNLRKTLQALVFAALPASASLTATGCCGGYQDPSESRQVVIDPNSVAYGDLVKQCRADDPACVSLCEQILADQEIAYPGEVYFTECRLVEAANTQVHMTYSWPEGCVGGRRPGGLEPCARPAQSSAVGAWLAHMAFLEAAAIPAFIGTAGQLEHLGAPASLVERALASAADEIRHTEIMAALARAWGVRPEVPRTRPTPPRDLYEACLENAVEGCVRETYGAVVATWQSQMAGDPTIRAAMVEIARDETEHAALSADIHAWAMPRLDERTRARIRARQAQAFDELRDSLRQSTHRELERIAGVPSAANALTLVDRLQRVLA